MIINSYISFPVPSITYLLDTYTAQVAYSLRPLSSSITNCIRVRRDSDNAEQDIGFDGDALDIASLETFVGGSNNGYVAKWYDQSGNGNDALQTTAGIQPIIVDTGSVLLSSVLGLPYVKNRSNSDKLNLTSSEKLVLEFSAINVFDRYDNTVSYVGMAGSSHTSTGNFNTTSNFRVLDYVTINNYAYGTSLGEKQCFTYRKSDTNTGVYIDGVQVGSDQTLAVHASNNLLSLMSITATQNNNRLMETILFNSDLSASETALNNEVNTYYGSY